MNLDVCIEPFFPGYTIDQKLKAIRDIGFSAYEFWFHDMWFDENGLEPGLKDFGHIAELNEQYGLKTVDFVLNHPDGGIIAALIQREEKQRILDNLEEMIGLAKKIGCTNFISGSGNTIAGLPDDEADDAMVEALSDIGSICQQHGMNIILEAFNTRTDHPDYYLDDPHKSIEILKRVNLSNVKMLYDIYHMQIMDGNIVDFLRSNIEWIGHFHIAGVPGRHEPLENNELNYKYIVNEIIHLGYTGYFGLEYWPVLPSGESLQEVINYFNE